MASINSLSGLQKLDPLLFLKECKETAIQNGESKKAQQIRTLIWKIQDLSDYKSKTSEIYDMLVEAGLVEHEEVKQNPGEPSSVEKSIKNAEKKLKDIAKLKSKQETGGKLEDNQLKKVEREQEILEELEELRTLVASIDSAK